MLTEKASNKDDDFSDGDAEGDSGGIGISVKGTLKVPSAKDIYI
jgi:hypothetical protein